MSLVDNKIAPAILAAIRKRRAVTSAAETVAIGARLAPAKIREVRFSDFAAVAELKRHWNLAADSYENWLRLWRHNPALTTGPQHPMGWVLESEGKVVGYLGNIIRLYRYGDRTLTSATGHAFVVEPAYRASGVSLVAAYFRQKSVDLYISTGAIQPVGNINRAFKAESLAQEDYKAVLFWVLRPLSFTRSVVAKLNLGRALSYAGGTIAGLAVAAESLVSRRGSRRSPTPISVTEIKIGELGDALAELWMNKVNERPALLFAERSPATTRWHFEVPADSGSVRVLCCSQNGALQGYAIIRNEGPDDSGLKKSIIADMLVRQNEPKIVKSLLIAAHEHAKKAGSDILEVVGFPPEVRNVCFELKPYTRPYPTPIFGYKAVDPILHQAISTGKTWYATPFDGDWSLIRPSWDSGGLRDSCHSELSPEALNPDDEIMCRGAY